MKDLLWIVWGQVKTGANTPKIALMKANGHKGWKMAKGLSNISQEHLTRVVSKTIYSKDKVNIRMKLEMCMKVTFKEGFTQDLERWVM